MKRNKFSLSHYKLLTMDMGNLVPLTWYEALPGDTIQQATSALVRVSPLLTPVMHPVHIRIHHWFVPNRLLWEDWEDFITGGSDGTSTPEHPYKSFGACNESSLRDYLGIPTESWSPDLEVSALPFRAYQMIYNEHYRDQDLVTEITIDKNSGQDLNTPTTLNKVSWQKDYFTTARPFEQKGDEVTIPLGESAPVKGIYVDSPGDQSAAASYTDYDGNDWQTAGTASYRTQLRESLYDSNSNGDPKAYADLAQATGIAINDLRLALSIQRYQEARARYGSRYVEYLRYLGVRSSDGRLSSPEYLGGGRQVIQFSEVLSTDGSNTGDMKGHGISAMRTNRYRRFFEEHGIVMSLMSVVPKSIYTTALDRGFNRLVKEDYFQRELQHLGEQEIPNREVQSNHSSLDDVFGYQARYDEYRSKSSSISGEFRSTLNNWHYGREFAGDIALNQSFTDATPTKRVNASSDTDALYILANHSIQARRMLTNRAVPKTF